MEGTDTERLSSFIEAHPDLWAEMGRAHRNRSMYPASVAPAARRAAFVDAVAIVGKIERTAVLAALDRDFPCPR